MAPGKEPRGAKVPPSQNRCTILICLFTLARSGAGKSNPPRQGVEELETKSYNVVW